MTKKAKDKKKHFPSKEEVLDYIHESDKPVGKREIARAFNIKGEDRKQLKDLLGELQDQGLIDRSHKRRLTRSGGLPEVTVIEVTGTDPDGELLGRPANWREEAPPPRIYLAPGRKGAPAIGRGDRVLARLRRVGEAEYDASPIRVLGGVPRQIVGVFERADGGGGRLRPTDRRVKDELTIRDEDTQNAEDGELVLVEVKPHHKRLGRGRREARVLECLGSMDDPRAISMIAIAEHDIPTGFSDEAVAEAEKAGPVQLAKRQDLRDLPLVTIDGADARDFDDAVHAEADDDPANKGGWRILVAIADVSHYVRANGPLDRNAYTRGNSVYFPDRVVPMLPEALSNGWCSLRPEEDRGCLAAFITIGADGEIRAHRFVRGLMRSAARLTYEQVQAARDGRPDETTEPLVGSVINPLYGAFESLLKARERRGTLELDIAERKVVISEHGRVERIEPRQRLDSHRLIEEFMITANVAAAQTLEKAKQPCMYRVHDAPDPAKVESLRTVLDSLDLTLARGNVKPVNFTRILERVEGSPAAPLVNDLVLRCQSQAVYSPQNLGHFGLALERYAHFTSPIRRYADLLVHRALISGLGLGKDGLPDDQAEKFEEIGEHISQTERRAAAAERDAVDRFTAAYLRERIGASFEGRINGVTRFGLFVTLDETGADGLVPISTLPDDYYDHVEEEHCLVGRRWGRVYRLGDRVRVRLDEADPETGGIVFDLQEVLKSPAEDLGAKKPAPTPRGPGTGKRRAASRKKAGKKAQKKAGSRGPGKGAKGGAKPGKPKGKKKRA